MKPSGVALAAGEAGEFAAGLEQLYGHAVAAEVHRRGQPGKPAAEDHDRLPRVNFRTVHYVPRRINDARKIAPRLTHDSGRSSSVNTASGNADRSDNRSTSHRGPFQSSIKLRTE